MLFFSNSKAQTVTLTEKNASLETLFKQIERQTGYFFVYRDEWIAQATKITINVKGVSLKEALDICFKEQTLSYIIVDKLIVVKQKEQSANTSGVSRAAPSIQKTVIKGVVKDSSNQPLFGATVLIKGTPKSAVTDAMGNFSIEVQPGQTLIVSYVGYETEENKVVGQGPVSLLLKPKPSELTNVSIVSTGYQKLPKERSAGSISTVNGDAIQNKSVSMNVIDRLEGLVPGLSVNYGTGNQKFMLRGLTTINANTNILFVVDGVPIYDINSITTLINPNDVDNISFLKDATATSIWGAEAANGVVVVTTKKGKPSSKRIQVAYSGFASFRGVPDYDYQHMMSSAQLVNAAKEIFSPVDYPWNVVTTYAGSNLNPVVYPHEKILYDLNNGFINQATANSRFDSLSSLNNRSQIRKHLQQPSFLTSHTINFNGGNEYHTYYGSMSYTNDRSAFKTDLNRYQLNLRQDFIFSPAIKLDLTTNMGYEQGKRYILTDLPNSINSYLPYAMFEDDAGNPLSQAYLQRYDVFRNDVQNKSRVNLDYIPLNEPDYVQNNNTNFSARINLGLAVKLAKGLTYETRGQYQRAIIDGFIFYNRNSYKVRDEIPYYSQAATTPTGAPTYYLPTTGGHNQTNTTTQIAWTVRNQLNFDRNYANQHQITALLGTEIRNTFTKGIATYRRGYDFQTQTYQVFDERFLATTGVANPIIQKNSSGNNTLIYSPVTFTEDEKRFFSLYANAAYSYKRRYNLNGSIRIDQANLFGTNTSAQYRPIWSIGGSWNVSKESFFKVKTINNLNLRLTYGLSGNAPKPGSGGPFDIAIGTSNSIFNGLGTGYIITVPSNSSLTWERTATTNVGVDFTIFNNRISGSVDVYNKKTTNLLGYQPIDPTNGWYQAFTNLGRLDNKGIEIQLNTVNISKKNFTWKSIFTIAHNRNKIVQLRSSLAPTFGRKLAGDFIEGYSAYSLFAFQYLGLNNSGNPMAKTEKGDTARLVSNLGNNDVFYNGVTQPTWYGGLTNLFTYKRFSLSFLIVYNLGYQMRRDVNQFYTGRLSRNLPEYFGNRWKQPGDELSTNIPKYIANPSANASQRYTALYTNADINIINASYAKLRDMTLSYDIPEKILPRLGMQSLNVYAQVNNIILWRNNKDNIDPEYYNLQTGTRQDRLPAFYTIGIKASFK